MLALGIRYLTGYAVATDVSSREQAEWPPHPARVFMALASAMFETRQSDKEQTAALEWLEAQGPPAIWASDAAPRTVVTHYVPVNDSGDPIKGRKPMTPLQSVPFGRDRQPRTFPRVRPSEDTVYLVWETAIPDAAQVTVLEQLCACVVRVGHSSSLVQMWVENRPPLATLTPSDLGEQRLRVASPGTLSYLSSAYNLEAIEAHAELQERLAEAKGKPRQQLKQELKERFGGRTATSLYPIISRWQGYDATSRGVAPSEAASGAFDCRILILAIDKECLPIGLESTWPFMTALRKTILSKCAPTPEWISGHRPDGTSSELTHLALLPLAFVDHQQADGHLMGVALAFPKDIELRERGRALSGLFYDDDGQARNIELRLGPLGKWTLWRETRPVPPLTLRRETWTVPSDTWASLTPIVLDRQPKIERGKNREGWSQEVAAIIATSCERQGLPCPVAVDVDKTSWHRGAPRAIDGGTSGFPPMPVKTHQTTRQQVHAWLRFDCKVEGPLLLGAGRYRGYGLCRPISIAR